MTEETKRLSAKVLKLRGEGLLLREIGIRLGISSSRIQQLREIGERMWGKQ